MTSLYFKSTPEVYAQIQPAIDEAFRVDWIDAGKCEHILPPTLPVIGGFCYIAIPDWMADAEGSEDFLDFPGIEKITEEEYNAAVTQEIEE